MVIIEKSPAGKGNKERGGVEEAGIIIFSRMFRDGLIEEMTKD